MIHKEGTLQTFEVFMKLYTVKKTLPSLSDSIKAYFIIK